MERVRTASSCHYNLIKQAYHTVHPQWLTEIKTCISDSTFSGHRALRDRIRVFLSQNRGFVLFSGVLTISIEIISTSVFNHFLCTAFQSI